jgi:hypothetical protein
MANKTVITLDGAGFGFGLNQFSGTASNNPLQPSPEPDRLPLSTIDFRYRCGGYALSASRAACSRRSIRRNVDTPSASLLAYQRYYINILSGKE